MFTFRSIKGLATGIIDHAGAALEDLLSDLNFNQPYGPRAK